GLGTAGGMVAVLLRPVKPTNTVRKLWGAARRSCCHDRDDAIQWCEASFPAGRRPQHEATEEVSRPCRVPGVPSQAQQVISLSYRVSGGLSPAFSLLSYAGRCQGPLAQVALRSASPVQYSSPGMRP